MAHTFEDSDQVMDRLKLIEVANPHLLELELDITFECNVLLVSHEEYADIQSATADKFSQNSDFPSEAGDGRSRPSEVTFGSRAERKFTRELLQPLKQDSERHDFMVDVVEQLLTEGVSNHMVNK
jgi:hypothetical protein